uniref:Ig-like domain-containing protein n=1 Tax=Sparus aurata TaxID=8175 RepID=A0A671XV43_SPAAU
MFMFLVCYLLFVSGWISASVSQSQIVEAQHGEEVTLQCNNIYNNGAVIFWFRLVDRTEVSCVSVKIYNNEAKYCERFQNGKFEMRSSNNTVSLKIRFVTKSDAGLYFCGFYTNGIPTFSFRCLNVKGKLIPVFLFSFVVHLCLFCISIIVKLQHKKQSDVNLSKQKDYFHLEDAALSFYPTPVRSRRPASERAVETQVTYTASRQTQRGSELN